MHSVVIGIGRHDDVVVAEVLHVVFHSQGGYEQVELLVLGHLLAALLEAVDGLAAEAEHRLVVGVARLGDGSACGVALGDEYAGLLHELLCLLGALVVEVEAAVAELAVVDVRLLVALAGLLLDSRDLFALLLAGLDLLLYDGDDVRIHMEVVVQVLGHEVVDERPDGGTVLDAHRAVRLLHLLFPGVHRTELHLGLRLEVGLLYLHADGSDDAHAAVLWGVVLLEEFLERLGHGLAVGGEVGASVPCVLAVDEGTDVLAVGVAVGDDYLYVVALQVDGRIQRSLAEVLVHEVEEAVLGLVRGAVEHEREAPLQVGVVADHRLHVVHMVLVLAEHHRVRSEFHERAVLLFGLAQALVHQLSLAETRPGALPVAV